MTFRAEDHFMKLKGNDYLPVVWRVVWVRDEHPDAQIETEVVFWDHDKQEIMVRAVVVLPKTGARATGHCVGTLAEFTFGYVEKCETQAIGRALALLGYGTAFAGQDLDEGSQERMADSPVTAAAQATGDRRPATASVKAPAAPQSSVAVQSPEPPANGNAPHAPELSPLASPLREPPDNAAQWTRAQLRAHIERDSGLELRTGQDWAQLARLYARPEPQTAADMTQEWLLALHQEMTARGYAAQIEAATSEREVTTAVQRALGDRDKRHVSAAHYDALRAAGEARKAELAAPLLSAVPQAVAS